MDSKKEVQHVYLVGAKSLGAYGGYETFVYKLTEYHQNGKNKMHAVKESIKFARDIIVAIYSLVLIVGFKCKKKVKACILVTNGMGYGGAPLVLLEAAKVYKKNGYKVILYTEFYGDLIKVCRDQKIEVWIVPRGWKMLSKLVLSCKFQFAFVNTAVMYKWVELFEKNNFPTIWWLHEGDSYIDPIAAEMPTHVASSTMVLTVSDRTTMALAKNGIQYKTRMLYYGLDDLAENEETIAQMNGKNIYTFLVMGAICSRKNQLFAIQAYNLLPKKIRAASKLMLVGTPLDEKDPYYIEFLRVVKQYPEIDYIPRVERSEIPALYRQINALICCSIDDPLPVVVTECFMFGKTVIISSGSGQYYMVKDEYDGYSYLESDVNALCKKMISAWSARDDKAMGEHARNLYTSKFTTRVFEECLMSYTNELTVNWKGVYVDEAN